MTEQHDEALVERVARAFYTERGFTSKSFDALPNKEHWIEAARAVIYPPKTRLRVARELWAAQYRSDKFPDTAHRISSGFYDDSKDMAAIIAALSLDKMED